MPHVRGKMDDGEGLLLAPMSGSGTALQSCPTLICPHMAYSSLSVPSCQPSREGRVEKASLKPSSATALLCDPQQVSDPL